MKNVLDGVMAGGYDPGMSDATTGAALVDNPYLVLAHLCDRYGFAWVVATLGEALVGFASGEPPFADGACARVAASHLRAAHEDLLAIRAAWGHR